MINTRIKIVRRTIEIPMTEELEDVYDIYHGLPTPLLFPIFAKWVIDKASLSTEDMFKYIKPWLEVRDVKILVK